MSDVTHRNTPSLWETLAYSITLTFFKRKKNPVYYACVNLMYIRTSALRDCETYSHPYSRFNLEKKKKSQLQFNSSQPVNKTKNKLLHAHLQPCHKYCVKSDIPLGMWVLHQFLQPHPLQHQSIYSTSGWRGESRGGEREYRGGDDVWEQLSGKDREEARRGGEGRGGEGG